MFMYKLQWEEVITEIDVDTFWNVKLLEVDSGWKSRQEWLYSYCNWKLFRG